MGINASGDPPELRGAVVTTSVTGASQGALARSDEDLRRREANLELRQLLSTVAQDP